MKEKKKRDLPISSSDSEGSLRKKIMKRRTPTSSQEPQEPQEPVPGTSGTQRSLITLASPLTSDSDSDSEVN